MPPEDNNEVQYLQYGDKTLVVIMGNEVITITSGTHANFRTVKEKLTNVSYHFTEAECRELLNLGKSLTDKLQVLSPDISYDGRNLSFKGKTINTSFVNEILDNSDKAGSQISAYLNFLANLDLNPSEEAKNDFYAWLADCEKRGANLNITNDGMLIAYRGMAGDSGTAHLDIFGDVLVNGETVAYATPLEVGAVVRSTTHSMNVGGPWEYSKGISDTVFRVEINPKDITRVRETGSISATRFMIFEKCEEPITSPVLITTNDWREEEYVRWIELGLPEEEAERYEANGTSFENALEELNLL